MTKIKRNKHGRPEKWEIAIIKAMLERFPKSEMSDQDILAYFTRPTRSLNHRVIGEIRNGKEYSAIVSKSSDQELDDFLKNWPHVDPQTGLSLIDDELIIKSREAILLAVQSFNNPKTYFRSEVFIVLAIISWTYLFHAFFKSHKIDYRQTRKEKSGKPSVFKTKFGADRYWDLSECLSHEKCSLPQEAKDNLLFLSAIRDEVEHRMTKRIDHELSSKFQACCLYYNTAIKKMFGAHLGLDKDLAIALQFSGFNTKQKKTLLKDKGLPHNIEAAWIDFDTTHPKNAFEDALELGVYFKKKIVSNPGQADEIINFTPIDGDPEDGSNVYIKYREPQKYLRREILKVIHDEGHQWFGPHQHTQLAKTLDAKKPERGYGATTLGGQWGWHDKWLHTIRDYCQKTKPIIPKAI